MIDLTINKTGLEHNIQKAKENNIIIPTIAQMQNPDLIPEKIKAKLSHTGLWDVDPVNLFRISWHNEAKEQGGLFQAVPNYVEIPTKLSGVPCRIVAMSGKWFPTGCHKVGASFGCLAPRLVTGQFDATYHHAVWPSTGNYCRGGAFNSKLLACESVAILPQDMSKERFDWLKSIAGQIIATPGCESNVKEIFDKTWELKKDPTMMIFNQFAEMGNPLWHYNVTGYALADLFEAVKKPGQNFAGACFTSGSAGTMSAGDLLKERYPHLKLAVGEALQCPTILDNGFGGHRIEGIGDKRLTDGFATGPAVFEDGFALGIKAVDLLDHGGELLGVVEIVHDLKMAREPGIGRRRDVFTQVDLHDGLLPPEKGPTANAVGPDAVFGFIRGRCRGGGRACGRCRGGCRPCGCPTPA